MDHRITECPLMAGDSQSVQRTPATQTQPIQTHTIQSRNVPALPATHPRTDWPRIPGTLPVASSYAYVLFDSRTTHSFVSSSFATLHLLPSVPMDHDLCVSTPVGKDLMTDRISKTCPIRIGDKELLADLILLELYDFDVILGMDWLLAHYALVDCNKKIVNFEIPGEEKILL
ncbi:uncharacterized protein LOC143857026 [Tasmannia lanceolata]|uniref:uncharacterized protein LOC143857026 n=1 Tax=Tasmannia lanceolata TaxID=3420 RepID=UPI00406470C1